MPQKVMGPPRIALIVVLLILVGVAITVALTKEGLWIIIIVAFAILTCLAGLFTGDSNVSGGPRFRRTRAFNPSSRVLAKLKAKKTGGAPPPEWPDPNIYNVDPNPPLGQPPTTNEASDIAPFDMGVHELMVRVETDEPVLYAEFPIPAPAGETIHELDVVLLDHSQGLLVKAWVFHGPDINGPLERSAIQTHQLEPQEA